MKRTTLAIITLVAVWLVVLLVPNLRWMLQAQLFGSSLQQVSALPVSEPPRKSLADLAKRYPDDVRVLAMYADEDTLDRPEPVGDNVDQIQKSNADFNNRATKGKLARYDQLIGRFPNNA